LLIFLLTAERNTGIWPPNGAGRTGFRTGFRTGQIRDPLEQMQRIVKEVE
jgi:hypothetical protein